MLFPWQKLTLKFIFLKIINIDIVLSDSIFAHEELIVLIGTIMGKDNVY